MYACLKLGTELQRLTVEQGADGAKDLRFRYQEVQTWFAGETVYGSVRSAVYPPATYAVLWPLLGWLDLQAARWLWAATSLTALAWLALVLLAQSGARGRPEQALIVVLPLAINATGVCLGNGQLTILQLAALLTGLVWLAQPSASGVQRELGAIVLLTAAMLKPNVAAPFFWIVLFSSPTIVPALVVVTLYAGLSLLASSFQPASLGELVRAWLATAPPEIAQGGGGYADLYTWLGWLGLEQWRLGAGIVVLGLSGIWVHRHRATDLWLQLGVVAMAARLWTYHRHYDDMLLLVPIVALYRIANGQTSSEGRTVAGLLIAALVVVLLVPARVHEYWSPPWPMLYATVHSATFVTILAFLSWQSRVTVARPRE